MCDESDNKSHPLTDIMSFSIAQEKLLHQIATALMCD
jgi:hypothetical protein